MQTLGCEGVPRALGLDQGRACASAIRVWLRSRGLRVRPRAIPSLRRLTGGAAMGAGVGREVVRHYPHLVERMSGIARAARVPLESLMDDVIASAYGAEGHPLGTPAAAIGVGAADPSGGVIARSFAPELPWIVRRSRPDIGFASIEVTLPWLGGAVAGINEGGLAVAVATPLSAPRERGLAAAPAWLLAQDCLQRFDGLAASIDWCRSRPSAGEFSLLLGDAAGEIAVIDVFAEGRQLRQRGVHGAVAGGTPAVQTSLRKRIDQGEGFAADWLGDSVPGASGIAGAAPAQVWLRSGDRSLEWRASEGTLG